MRDATGLAWETLKNDQRMIDAMPSAATLARCGFIECDSEATRQRAWELAATDEQRVIAAGLRQLRWLDETQSAELAAWMATLRAHGFGCGFARREQGSLIVQVWAPSSPSEAVKAARARLGLTQAAFAEALNALAPGLKTNQPLVWKWEQGKIAPAPATLALIRGMRPGD